MTKKTIDYTGKIENVFRLNGISYVREYMFLKPHRRFQFDFLITGYEGENLIDKGIKIAVEFEGGIYIGGRHIRGRTYSRDCEKYNLAQINGFIVLRYTPDWFGKKNGEFLIADEVIVTIFQARNKFESTYHTNHFKKKWKTN